MEEIVVLIGTAVCGKPHVRWCERVDGVKRPSLYFNLLEKIISFLQKKWKISVKIV